MPDYPMVFDDYPYESIIQPGPPTPSPNFTVYSPVGLVFGEYLPNNDTDDALVGPFQYPAYPDGTGLQLIHIGQALACWGLGLVPGPNADDPFGNITLDGPLMMTVPLAPGPAISGRVVFTDSSDTAKAKAISLTVFSGAQCVYLFTADGDPVGPGSGAGIGTDPQPGVYYFLTPDQFNPIPDNMITVIDSNGDDPFDVYDGYNTMTLTGLGDWSIFVVGWEPFDPGGTGGLGYFFPNYGLLSVDSITPSGDLPPLRVSQRDDQRAGGSAANQPTSRQKSGRVGPYANVYN